MNPMKKAVIGGALLCTAPLVAAQQPDDWSQRIKFSGLLEAEASFGETYAGADQSDIVLATASFGLEAKVNDRVSGTLIMLHEDDDTDPMELDEGYLTLDFGNGLDLSAGRMYVPFGHFESHMISDPLTLDIGETRQSALKLGYENSGFYANLYIFNGDTQEAASVTTGEDTIDQTGLSLGYAKESEGLSYDIGVDYISNIADSSSLTGTAGVADSNSDGQRELQSYVSAMVVHASLRMGDWHVIGEFLKSGQFNSVDLAFNGQGAELSAHNLELGYNFEIVGRSATVAVAAQGTDEALALGLPERRMLIGLSTDIDDNTSLSFEYAKDDDYDTAAGGTGNDKSTITLQLAVSF